jgi:beta-galactosidase/beta-glucuronidase
MWQTVWLEAVPKTFIVSTKQTPDVDKKLLHVSVQLQNRQAGDELKISVWDGANKIAEETIGGNEIALKIANPKLWSPSNIGVS